MSLAGPLNSVAQELRTNQGDNTTCLPSTHRGNWGEDWLDCVSRKGSMCPATLHFRALQLTTLPRDQVSAHTLQFCLNTINLMLPGSLVFVCRERLYYLQPFPKIKRTAHSIKKIGNTTPPVDKALCHIMMYLR